ncbi:MAG: MATE family efflux transporter [Eubacterium sp.]|nr:MATE family efflux transporter [Eubacterium sp.]
MKHANDFLRDMDCFREFARYASLNVLGMLGLSCYILADTYFIASGLGADGLTALNLAIPVYSFIHGSGLLAGMGGGTRYSIFKSLGNHQEADRLFTNTVFLAAALAGGFVCAGAFFTDGIVTALGADASVFAMTSIYLKMILLCSPAFLLNNVLLCFVRNDGAPQLSMRAMLGGSLSNVALDYLFIFPCRMGMFGAVLATCLAPAISLALLSPHFLKKNNQFRLVKCCPNGRHLAAILASGAPSLVTEVSSGIVMIVFNTIILRLRGNIGVAAYGVIANLSLVVIAVYNGIAQGSQPVISRHYGSGKQKKAHAVLRYALTTMLLLSVLIYAGTYAFAPQIAGLFNKEHDETLQRIAVEGLKLYFTACPFVGFNLILATYFTAIARPLPANLISLLRGFIVILPLAVFFSAAFQMTGIWCAFPVTELLVAAAGAVCYACQKT